MEAELKKASCDYLEGLISHREYVGTLINILGKAWEHHPEGVPIPELPAIAERLSKDNT